MKSVFIYLKRYVKELILGPLFKLIEAILELTVPIVMAGIIDNGVANHDVTYIWQHFILLVVIAICGLCSAFICQYYAAKCAYGFGTDLRNALYSKINSFSYADLDKFGISSLTTRIINDSNVVQTGVNMFIRLAIRDPFLIIGAIVMAFVLDWKMALIFVIIAPVLSVILYFVMKYTVPGYRENQNKLDGISRKVHENLDGTRVIRAFSRQQEEIDAFNKQADELSESVIRVQKISALLNPVSTMVMNIGIAAIIVAGGFRINSGSLTQGELTAFINYMTSISLTLVVFANLINTFIKSIASAKRLQNVLEHESSMESGKKDAISDSDYIIEFNDVSFKYPNSSEESIKNISFKLKKGEILGIIGGTGSGKSTIANLIPRLYDSTDGEIKLGGANLSEYSYEKLRTSIGIVPQKNVLFRGSIAENIRFRDKNLTEEEIYKALETAQCTEFVNNLPEKINSSITQGGTNFSGGQRQRLCIARAVAGSPSVIILDDSMSALDFATDLAVRKAIKKNCPDSAIIIVSQRATSLMDSDNILVMENGECIAQGKHDKLLETCGAYREIYNSQIENN